MEQLRVLRSVCPLDCPDTCAVDITVRGNEMLKLSGASDHPITQGFACVKMSKYPMRQHHQDRLGHPMRRVGEKGEGRFTRCTWDEALDEIAEGLQRNIAQYGEQSVLPFSYAGTMGLIECEHPAAFFRAIGARELDWTICAATAGAAWEANYGPNKLSTPPESVQHSKLIILWGINALRSNSPLGSLHEKSAQGGGPTFCTLTLIATRRAALPMNTGRSTWDRTPGLALALGSEIIRQEMHDSEFLQEFASGFDAYCDTCSEWTPERAAELSGVDAKLIRRLAKQIGTEPATFIKIGYGMTRNEGGGNAARAITLLPSLTGAWKHRGGGGALSTSGGFGLNDTRYSGKHLLKPNRRHINPKPFRFCAECNRGPDIYSLCLQLQSSSSCSGFELGFAGLAQSRPVHSCT